MKIFQYCFSLNPDIADSALVDNIQNKLSKYSIDSYVMDLSTADKLGRGLPEDSNYLHVIKGYYMNNGDIIRFIRLKNDTLNIFQLDINRNWRFTPKYFRNMIKLLGAKRDEGYSFNEIDVPDIKRSLFKEAK